MITLSQDQEKALKNLLEWYKKDRDQMQFVTLGGYAGTGKTTLIAVLRRELHKLEPKLKVGFVSFTGKAARVLHSKITEQKVLFKQDTVGTIHSLIYKPLMNEKEEIIGWIQKEEIDRNLIIIDEASMVDGLIWEHLLSYQVPMIVVGDHGQLPPVKGNFNLMQKPVLTLDEIHRQAAKNPIIGVSIQAREKGEITAGRYSTTVVKFSKVEPDINDRMEELLQNYSPDTLILCGYNSTRKRLNTYIRRSKGIESEKPVVGDRVICLRNNHRLKIFNGMLGTIESIKEKGVRFFEAEIQMDGETGLYSGTISAEQFHSDVALNYTDKRILTKHVDLFDFGYALTVHKAQGSQARSVILFEERFSKMNDEQWRRWLYTGVTRASEKLYIFPSR